MITLDLMRTIDMGMFSAVGRLFGTDKAIENILDKDNGLITQVGTWFGNKDYTDQERAIADAQHREWGLRQLDALAPYKILQRVLAIIIFSIWAIIAISLLIAIFAHSEYAVDNIKWFMASNYILDPTMSVASLYFSGGVIDSFNRKNQK